MACSRHCQIWQRLTMEAMIAQVNIASREAAVAPALDRQPWASTRAPTRPSSRAGEDGQAPQAVELGIAASKSGARAGLLPPWLEGLRGMTMRDAELCCCWAAIFKGHCGPSAEGLCDDRSDLLLRQITTQRRILHLTAASALAGKAGPVRCGQSPAACVCTGRPVVS